MGHSYGVSYLSFADASLGVWVFFVISGFLITSLLIAEKEKRGRIDLQRFYLRRTLRIFPVFYIYIITVAVLDWAGTIDLWPSEFLLAVVYLFNFHDLLMSSTSMDVWYVAHSWSLACEEQYYLIWPLCIALLHRKRAIQLLAAAIIVLPLLRVSLHFLAPSTRGYLGKTPIMCAEPIIIGSAAALLNVRGNLSLFIQRYSAVTLPAVSCATLFCDYVLLAHLGGGYSNTLSGAVRSTAIAILMLWCIEYHRTFPGRFLNSPPLVFVGRISYSLYLWQQLFLTPGKNQSWFGTFPQNWVCAFVVATLSYWLIESRFHRPRTD